MPAKKMENLFRPSHGPTVDESRALSFARDFAYTPLAEFPLQVDGFV